MPRSNLKIKGDPPASPAALRPHELAAVDRYITGARLQAMQAVSALSPSRPVPSMPALVFMYGDILTDRQLIAMARLRDELAAAVAAMRTEETT